MPQKRGRVIIRPHSLQSACRACPKAYGSRRLRNSNGPLPIVNKATPHQKTGPKAPLLPRSSNGISRTDIAGNSKAGAGNATSLCCNPLAVQQIARARNQRAEQAQRQTATIKPGQGTAGPIQDEPQQPLEQPTSGVGVGTPEESRSINASGVKQCPLRVFRRRGHNRLRLTACRRG